MNINNKLDSIVDINLPFGYYLDQFFYIKLGFESHLLGSHYLLYFIEQSLINNYNIYELSPTKDIYPYISKKFKVGDKKVEHAIRNATEKCWLYMKEEIKEIVFPIKFEKPTNSQVLFVIYDYIKAYYPKFNFNFENIEINNKIMNVSDNWINYQISFFLQQYLEQKYKIYTKFGIFKLHMLVDAIIYSMQTGELTQTNYINLVKYINKKYSLCDLEFDDVANELIESNASLFKMCKHMYTVDNSFPKPENKSYVKKYLNNLSTETSKIIK